VTAELFCKRPSPQARPGKLRSGAGPAGRHPRGNHSRTDRRPSWAALREPRKMSGVAAVALADETGSTFEKETGIFRETPGGLRTFRDSAELLRSSGPTWP